MQPEPSFPVDGRPSTESGVVRLFEPDARDCPSAISAPRLLEQVEFVHPPLSGVTASWEL